MQAPHAITIGTEGAPDVVFAHGWGRSHRDFIPVAEALAPIARCHLLDLPGFGDTPRPDVPWGSAAYADYLQRSLRDDFGLRNYTWVGHSFGGRIGLRLGAAGADLYHLVIVAGAGVPRQRSQMDIMRGKIRGWRFRMAKKITRREDKLIVLEQKYGSLDYVHSREIGLRDVFLATISEDQSAALPKIKCPTTLLYGGLDTETPPEIGRKIAGLIPDARYLELDACDHISILDRGRHQIALEIKRKLGGAA